ncbi:MAG: deoxynucleoside kinase [Peptostreptococcaceae bacterium]|jgi:dTMP kinase|nr:deoxynucleoside kinase [Peptostreptococcaceae bacterium]
MSGKLIIIESGSDGSGKATQSKKLYDRLLEEGYKVRKVEYPNYESSSSSLIKMYLKGEFGDKPDDVDAYVASTFYTVDRYASYKRQWEEFYLDGGIIIADRYTTSNMVHQASKIDDIKQRDAYLDWLFDYEYNLYKLPQPSQVIFLDVNPDVTSKLMENRNNKFSGESKKDIHESNMSYLKKTYENSLYIANKYNWTKINCIENQNLRTIDDIHEEIYSKVKNHIDNN